MARKTIVVLVSLFLLVALATGMTITGENMISIGKPVTVESTAAPVSNVVVVGADAHISGQVTDNVVVVLGNIYLEDGAVVRGDVVSVLGSVVRRGNSQVFGEVVSISAGDIDFRGINMGPLRFFRNRLSVGSLWRVAWVVLFGMLALWVAPRPVNSVADAVKQDPLKSVLYGLVAYLVLVPLTLVMVISLLGIPLIPVLWTLVLLGRFLGQVALGLVAGRYILRPAQGGSGEFGTVAIGLLLLGLVTLIPVLGGFASLFYGLAGFGAVVWTRFGRQPAVAVALPVSSGGEESRV